ncbi:hypothetical protein GCM10009119_35810 [Algoriphagus jejuensis]|uniref:Uncharacterized protein n=1 Tax=Algoriphagus jejuensis TaxID=419934 RepID=A0ABN1N4S0_9BACT
MDNQALSALGTIRAHASHYRIDSHGVPEWWAAGPLAPDRDHVGLDDFCKIVFQRIVQALLDVQDQLVPDNLKLGIHAPSLHPDAEEQREADQDADTFELQFFHDTKLGDSKAPKNRA